MATWSMSYKGRDIKVVQPDDEHAEVTIEGHKFSFELHGGPLPMWMCEDAYFGSPVLTEVIRHLVDYWYIVADEERTAPPVKTPEPDLPGGVAHGGHHH